MTGLDTNILIRYLTEDDPSQFTAALDLLRRKGAVFFVSNIVLVELDWVLSSVYDWTREEVAETIARLLTVHNLVFEDEGMIRGALRAFRRGADLSDGLISALAEGRGCQDIATFDKGFLRHFPRLSFRPG